MRRIFAVFSVFLCLSLTGCYQLAIEQGNVLTPHAVSQLKVGMTRAEVLKVLGQTVLDQPMDSPTWYYVHTYKPGRGHMQSQHVTLYFQGDKLTHFTSDIQG